eukprot:scaffold4481_cov121-Cylindrotheca_fusiformis.AAC.1
MLVITWQITSQLVVIDTERFQKTISRVDKTAGNRSRKPIEIHVQMTKSHILFSQSFWNCATKIVSSQVQTLKYPIVVVAIESKI